MRATIVVLALAFAVTGCSLIGLEHNDPPPVVPLGEPEGILVVDLDAPARADASGITVEEGVRRHLGGNAVLVQGVLFIDDALGTMWLCEGLFPAEMAPQPSCERPALLLQHPDPAGLQVREMNVAVLEAGRMGDLQQSEDVRWAEDAFFFGSLLDPLAPST